MCFLAKEDHAGSTPADRSKIMKHKHHIVPRYLGGTDEKSNLVELSVQDHAEAHRKLYEEYGNWQDFLAWQGLLKLLTTEECGLAAVKMGYQKSKNAMIDSAKNSKAGMQNVLKRTGMFDSKYSDIRIVWNRKASIKGIKVWTGQKHTLESRKKMSDARKEYYQRKNAVIV